MKTSSVVVVFPVHNEAKNLEKVLAALLKIAQRERYDLLAIDDASTDDSLAILHRWHIPTIALLENLGYGAAVQTGYKYAVAKGYEYLVQIDSDGQHDPRFLPFIVQKLHNHDFVIGSRFLESKITLYSPSRELYKGTRLRKAGIHLFRMLLYMMTHNSISDPTSGYIGMNRKCCRFLSNDFYPHDFPDADVIYTLIRNGFKLCEVPVYMYYNTIGGSLHRGLAPLYYMYKCTLSLFVASIRKKHGSKK